MKLFNTGRRGIYGKTGESNEANEYLNIKKRKTATLIMYQDPVGTELL